MYCSLWCRCILIIVFISCETTVVENLIMHYVSSITFQTPLLKPKIVVLFNHNHSSSCLIKTSISSVLFYWTSEVFLSNLVHWKCWNRGLKKVVQL